MRSIALILRTHLIDPDAECVIKDSIEEGVDKVIVFTPDVDETSKFVAARGWETCVLVYRGAGPNSKKLGLYNSCVCFSYMLKAGVVISEEPLALKKERIVARALGVFVFQLADGVVTKRKAFISHKCCSADNKEMKSKSNNSKVRAALGKIIKLKKIAFGLVRRRLHHVGYDVVTASSDLDAIVSKARVPYQARDGKLFVFPLPRFRLFEARANANKILTKKKVNILFAPTKINEGEFDEELLSCNELRELKEKNDLEYLYRGHVKEQKEKNLSGFKYANDNALLGLNLCDYLQDADVLVTDYSSIYVDSLPFGLPVIFFKTKQSNQALPDKTFWPGPVVNSTQELAVAISDAVKLKSEFWKEEREVAYRVLVSERKESVFRFVPEAR